MVQAMRQLAQAGLAPSQVAEMVFDAIRQEKFYILTHPTTKQGVQLRMEDILRSGCPRIFFRQLNSHPSRAMAGSGASARRGCRPQVHSQSR